MKHIRKTLTACLILVLVCVFMPAVPMYAEGTTVIAVSKSSMNVGDKLTVTVRPSQSATISLKYNSGVLRFTGCSAEGYTSQGNVVTYTGTTAEISFEAVSAGSSGLIVTSQEVSGSSTTVQVTDAAVEQPDQSASGSSQTGQNTQTTAQFEIDGTSYVVSERYSSKEIPEGFSKTEVAIKDSSYKELSNGKMILVYLKPASNTSGSGMFYIYNQQDQTVSPMVLVGTMEDYVILLTPAEIPSKLSQADVTVGERQISAYQVSENPGDFYYLYGMDESGNEEWFEYDAADGSIQRANTSLLEQEESPDVENIQTGETASASQKDIFRLRIVIAALIFVLVVFVIVIINLILSRRRSREEFDFTDTEDEEFSEELPEEIPGEELFVQEAEKFSEVAGEKESENETEIRSDVDDSDEFYQNDTPEMRAMFSDDVIEGEEKDDKTQQEESVAQLERELNQMKNAQEETEKQKTEDNLNRNFSDATEDFQELEILDLNDL